MTKPETIKDSNGKWTRRDAFVSECSDDWDEPEDRLNEIVDELLEEGTMRSYMLDGTEYIQLTSKTAAAKVIARGRAKMAKNRINDIIRSNDD